MIGKKQLRDSAKVLHSGLSRLLQYLGEEGPAVIRTVGERTHLVKPRRGLGGLGLALGLLGVAAVIGVAAKSGTVRNILAPPL